MEDIVQLIFLSIIMISIWVFLLRWARKFRTASYIVIANFAIYITYIIWLFKPLFFSNSLDGGESFAIGMTIMIFPPFHLLLTYLTILLFIKSDKSIILRKVTLYIGLPLSGVILGYLLQEKKVEIENTKDQKRFKSLQQELKNEELANSKTLNNFNSFLEKFTKDESFQKSHTKLPLATYILNNRLEVDSVYHNYEYQWKPQLTDFNKSIWIFQNWDYFKTKSSQRTLSKIEKDTITDYNFEFDKSWKLCNIKKRVK